MTIHSYIKLKPGSLRQNITIDELKGLLNDYKSSISKTAHQLNWEYNERAFPYMIREPDDNNANWFYLVSEERGYHLIALGIDNGQDSPEEDDEMLPYIQITLVDSSTYGDKAKANEFAKYLAKKLKGELHLFNGRVIHNDLKK